VFVSELATWGLKTGVDAPQAGQNVWPGKRVVPHSLQYFAADFASPCAESSDPQDLQNASPDELSAPHIGHLMIRPPIVVRLFVHTKP